MLLSKHDIAGNRLFFRLSWSPEISFFIASVAVQPLAFFSDSQIDQLEDLPSSRAGKVALLLLSQ